MHPGFLATTFRDWGNTRVFLQFIGCGGAFTLFTKGDEEAGGKDRPSPWQGVKQGEVRLALGVPCNSFIAVCDHPQGDPELGDEGVHQEGMGRAMPASVVRAVALWMAGRRVAMRAAERP